MKNLAYAFIDDLMIIVQSPRRALDEESRQMLDEIPSRGITSLRALVFSDGGSPSPSQRRHLDEVLKGRDIHIALVSDKTSARLAANAIGLFSSKIKAFTSRDLDAALSHLKVTPTQRNDVMSTVSRLQSEITPD